MFLYKYMTNQQEVPVLPVSTDTETTETQEVMMKKRNREEQEKGYVYVFSNPMYSYYGENVYKIGYSKEPEKRVHDFDTGYPEETTIVYTYKHNKHQYWREGGGGFIPEIRMVVGVGGIRRGGIDI